MKIAILGAGLQGRAACYYLLSDPRVSEFTCYDSSETNLSQCGRYLGEKGKVQCLDAKDSAALIDELKKVDGVVNTLPYILIEKATRACIAAGKSAVDLGGNDNVAAEQKKMHLLAMEARVTISPGCGLAPGIISDLAYDAAYGPTHSVKSRLDFPYKIEMYCGGLLLRPKGELRHAAFFNIQGLYNEYRELPRIRKHGRVAVIEPLAPGKYVEINTPVFRHNLESAATHGAFDPESNLWYDVEEMDYYTLRYSGHFEQIREKINFLFEPEFIAWMENALAPPEDDIVVLRVEAYGVHQGKPAAFIYELEDICDKQTGLSAMQRCTGFPAAETLLQILSSKNWPHGVVPHEAFVDMPQMLANLSRMGISIRGYYDF